MYLFTNLCFSSVQLDCSVTLEQSTLPSFHVQASPQWLNNTLTPKIRHWTEIGNLTTTIKSLRLVSLDRYSQVYSMLKDKYGADLVKVIHFPFKKIVQVSTIMMLLQGIASRE